MTKSILWDNIINKIAGSAPGKVINPVKKQRTANIELLRLFAMCGVVFLHYYNGSIGGGIKYVPKGSKNEFVLQLLESLFICAVDTFVIISGYFLSKSNRRTVGKCINLLVQLLVFRVAFYWIYIAKGLRTYSRKTFIREILPVNWFVILYIVLYLVSPLINKAFCGLPVKKETNRSITIHTAVLGVFLLFSVWPTFVDVLYQKTGDEFRGLSTLGMYGSERGYTITNFILCYIIGLYVGVGEGFKYVKKRVIIPIWLACVIIIVFWAYRNTYNAYEYCNPVVVIEALSVFLLFLKIKIPEGHLTNIINTISKCSFSVYLLHGYFIRYIKIETYVRRRLPEMCLHICVSIGGIVAVCFAIDFVYGLLYGLVKKKVDGIGEYRIE